MQHRKRPLLLSVKAGFALSFAAPFASMVVAQTAPAPAPNPARQAIENRKAVFTLIGNNFRPIAEILRGNSNYESVEVSKYSARVAFLTGLLPEAFPDISKSGDTQAKPEVWSSRPDFDKRVRDFSDHTAALSHVIAQGGGNSDAFKAAAKAVAQDCKGCHDNYRNK